MCKDIKNDRKLCIIIIDESTTLSKRTMLIICLRSAIKHSHEVSTFLFLDTVDLNCTADVSIKNAILCNSFK